MAQLRFGVLVPPDNALEERRARWSLVESLGFDLLYTADHSRDYRRAGPWFDGWTDLAAMALSTSRVRIGALVSNPILRGPTLLAREAMAVDHLSGGRLELAIGTGIAGFDHDAMGVPYWEPKERVARYREYVTMVDELLKSSEPYRFDGTYYSTRDAVMTPGPAQQPRPPITVAGQSPTVRRVAAERADCWNTHGPYNHSLEQILAITRRQNAEMDDACREIGRDPADVRRSLLLYGPLNPVAVGVSLDTVVEPFAEAGMREFVLFWPDESDGANVLEKMAASIADRFR